MIVTDVKMDKLELQNEELDLILAFIDDREIIVSKELNEWLISEEIPDFDLDVDDLKHLLEIAQSIDPNGVDTTYMDEVAELKHGICVDVVKHLKYITN